MYLPYAAAHPEGGEAALPLNSTQWPIFERYGYAFAAFPI